MVKRPRFLPEKLSGGEKQRVAIARALAGDPALLLAVEPAASLDTRIEREIMRLLRRIATEQHGSIVIVSHDQRVRDIADRVLRLEDGQFKDVVAMAIDPVRDMAVERERAVTAEWSGRAFAFCSRGCRGEFLAQPERFAHAAHSAGWRRSVAGRRAALAARSRRHQLCLTLSLADSDRGPRRRALHQPATRLDPDDRGWGGTQGPAAS